MKRALITGVKGQDGSYLAEKLIELELEVHGLTRKASSGNPVQGLILHEGNLAETSRINDLVAEIQPDVIFNLGGISSVAESWKEPARAGQVNGIATAHLLAAAIGLQESTGSAVRFVQASSSEIFGSPQESPQTEHSRIAPTNPYGAAKAYAHQMTALYRSRGLFASNAILFNHESPRRPSSFVTRKITSGVARIALGLEDTLVLGNLEARRDWGWAPDYVDALVRMALAERADDFVIATGATHSVREFLQLAFNSVGVSNWERHVEVDAKYMRPSDPQETRGDASHAESELKWKRTVGFEEIVARMTISDYNSLSGSKARRAEASWRV